jgi:hypothetical protein
MSGKETQTGFQPLRQGYTLANMEPIVRFAIGSIKQRFPNDVQMFFPYYETMRNTAYTMELFSDPGQEQDKLYVATRDEATGIEADILATRVRRPDSERTRVWYGPIGSGETLLKNALKRNELRDKYGVIGLEMEAAGIMNRIPVGVVRGVCDYGDQHKNKEWQPYAAAMAAAYAKAILNEITPETVQALESRGEQTGSRGKTSSQISVSERNINRV